MEVADDCYATAFCDRYILDRGTSSVVLPRPLEDAIRVDIVELLLMWRYVEGHWRE